MMFRRRLCPSGWLRRISVGAPWVLGFAAGLMCVRDARGDSAAEQGAAAEAARPRPGPTGSDRIGRSTSARSPSKAESPPPDAPARPGAAPATSPADGRTQAKATAPENDERRAPRAASATPCGRAAPAAPRPAKGRGKATKKISDDAPCPATDNGGAVALPEPTRNARGAIENSEPAHSSGVSAAIENLAFQNGEVPHARAALERIKKDFAKCAVMEPGPAEGTVEFRFIVRAPGKAEGVDVARVKGVSANIVRCATAALTLRSVGAPSSEPVGVILTVRFGNS